MQASLETASSYSKNRKMFGSKNLDQDGIQWMLGAVATDFKVSKPLYRKAIDVLSTLEGPLLATHANRFLPNVAVKASNARPQFLGGRRLLQP